MDPRPPVLRAPPAAGALLRWRQRTEDLDPLMVLLWLDGLAMAIPFSR